MALPMSAEDIEIRSEIATGNMVYDYQNAPFLWMDLDKNISSEVITITTSGTDGRTIADGALTYVCIPQVQTYKNPAIVDTYEIIGFLGNKFVIYDQSNELVRLLVNWDNDDKATIAVGDSYLMPEGYELKVREIDLDGNKCALTLLKGGVTIDEEIVENGNTYEFENSDDVLIFAVNIDSVFRGTDSNFCQMKYIWLVSEEVLKVTTSDSFGELEVTGTNPITLTNDGAITLGADDEIDLTDDLVIRVADNDTTLMYYIAKIVKCPTCVECPECENCTECEECPECPDCSPCPTVNETINETIVYVPADPVPVDKKTLPGFEAIFALMGLTGVAYMVLRQKE
jgi:S-layer protein (TIGR01567 family)